MLTGLDAVVHPPVRAVVTVGVFDGVHLAHQALIRVTVSLASRLKGTSVAITFDPDPQVILDPPHAQPLLMSLDSRVGHLRALGIDVVWVIPFTKRFARLTAEQFIQRILVERLHAVALVVGERFVFGRNRQGDMEMLQALGPTHGMRIVPVRQVRRGGEPIDLPLTEVTAHEERHHGEYREKYGVAPFASIEQQKQILFPRSGVAWGAR